MDGTIGHDVLSNALVIGIFNLVIPPHLTPRGIVNPRGQLIGKTMANFPRCPLSFHFTALFDYNANTG